MKINKSTNSDLEFKIDNEIYKCNKCNCNHLPTDRFCLICGKTLQANLNLLINPNNQDDIQNICLASVSRSEELFYYGIECEKSGNYNNAIKYYSKAIKENPNFIKPLTRRAWLYEKQNNKLNAIKDYINIIKIRPSDEENYISCGALFANIGKNTLALRHYNVALKINTQCAKAYYNRAMIYLETNSLEKAVEDLDKCVEYDHEFYLYTHLNRGIANIELNKPQLALADFYKILYFEKNLIEAFYWRSIAYLKLNNEKKALKDLNIVLKSFPNAVQPLQKRGIVFHRLKEYQKSLIDFTKAYKLAPNSQINCFNLGLSLLSINKHSKALIYLNKAIEIKSDSEKYYFYRAQVNFALNKSKEAFQDYKKSYILAKVNKNKSICNKALEKIKLWQ